MSTLKAYAPLLTCTPQGWIRGKLWHATRLSCHILIKVFVDTGAEGGRGGLRVSGVSPMEVIGSCFIPMMFSSVGRIFRVLFRIVRDLPYTVVLGAAFMKERQSTTSFQTKEGFRPTPESAWVPFYLHTTSSEMPSKNVTPA